MNAMILSTTKNIVDNPSSLTKKNARVQIKSDNFIITLYSHYMISLFFTHTRVFTRKTVIKLSTFIIRNIYFLYKLKIAK